MRIVIITPIFQDWESFERMVAELDREIVGARKFDSIAFSILAVDDGSIDQGPVDSSVWPSLRRIRRIDVLRMAANMGHQRAIALGAVHVVNEDVADAAIIMDADGEDLPSDVIRLIAMHLQKPGEIVLARRSKRSESSGFRLGYRIYQLLFRLLTGQSISFGNFSLVPRPVLARLVCNCDIWNHFAAAVSRSRQPVTMIATIRGTRYAGHSSMNWVSLVIHGLSAMSVHSDRIAVRLILVSAAVMGMSIAAIAWVTGIRLLTDLAIPGWASQVVGTLALASLISIGFAAQLAFVTLQSRQGVTFVPKTDGSKYIRQVERWLPKQAAITSAQS